MSMLYYSVACRSMVMGVMRIPCLPIGKIMSLVCLLWFGAIASRADTHYVSLDGANNSPYLNWADAATQIQWAVDQAVVGDTVLVSNGTYNLTNQINILSNITVQSLNGTNFTSINGNYPACTNRCVLMSAGTLDGFTISNGFLTNAASPVGYPWSLGGAGIGICGGATVKNCYIYKNYITNCSGGGIHVCQAAGVTITNCSVVGNICSANKNGGGIFFEYAYSPGLLVDSYIAGNIGGYGGGVYNYWGNCRITNCTIAGNTAVNYHGGVRLEAVSGVAMANCVISNNSASDTGGMGILSGSKCINSVIINNIGGHVGGVSVQGTLSNCQVIGNTATLGGAVRLSGSAGAAYVVANCIIARNSSAWNPDGTGLRIDNGGLAINCLIYCNTNSAVGSGVFLGNNALYTNYPYGLINCTIVDNVSWAGSGIYASGTNNYVENCIVVSNVTFAGAQVNIYNDTAANTNNYWHTCAPDTLAPNQGNITGAPAFVDTNTANYRLGANSPCINTGTNQGWMTNAVDLDGRQRIRYGTVDMGAYEHIQSGTIFGFH